MSTWPTGASTGTSCPCRLAFPTNQQQVAVFDPARGHSDIPGDALADLARRLGERMTG
ncbi:hypothetical protein [Amycolatopsis sp. WAC 01375]|uniref:hypothetical protein n=1 Tax=Amycolatopsis sp. WAC 01375 TaxID=2203194 RepID=UPI001315A1F0|nr:hypothetical protein [Amycolatopsis sp. WAC 01375]